MSAIIVSYGALSSGLAIGIGDTLTVEAGGTAVLTQVQGGDETLYGRDSGTTVDQHGYQGVSAGGVAFDTTVEQDAKQTIASVGTAVSALIISGGEQVISADGVASDTTVSGGGLEIVSAQGSAVGTVVAIGGTAVVASGQVRRLQVESGGSATIGPSGSADTTEVSSGGVLFAYSGSTLSGLTIDAGGYAIVAPGTVLSDVHGAGSLLTAGIAVAQSGSGVMTYGSAATALFVSGGAQEFVLSGGTATSGTLESGAILRVLSGGAARAGTLSNSDAVVSSGGFASGLTLEDDSAQFVFSGGSAADTVVDLGFAIIDSGGSAQDVVVNSGGIESVVGIALSTTVDGGGGLNVVGGTALRTLIESSGFAFVYGTVDTAQVAGGGYMVVSNGDAVDVTVASGATVIGSAVSRGVTSFSDTVVSRGGLVVLLGAVADSGTMVESGGTLVVLPNVDETNLQCAPGADIVSAGAVVTISGGTAVTVSSGTALGLVLGSGATGFVLQGGAEQGTVIGINAEDDILGGGTAIDTTIAAGGTLRMFDGAVVSGAVTFSGSDGALILDSAGLPHAAISGFASGDSLDLPFISGVSATATLLSGNILAVADGTTSASLQLDPTQSFSGETFSTAVDRTGGTLVTVTPAAAAPSQTAVADDVQPVDIPLYLFQDGSDGYKVGIEVSLDGGTTYKMYTFDTGASGFYAAYNPAWWSSYAVVNEAPAVNAYGNGTTYTAQAVSTSVTLLTTSGTALSLGDQTIGLISSASNADGDFTPQSWNAGFTGTPSTGTLGGVSYGDFGVGINSTSSGIETVLAQLMGGLGDGFIITLGDYPDGSTGQIGTLQIGLTQADIQSFDTAGSVVPLEGQNTVDTFPGSDEPSYQEAQIAGSLAVSSGTESDSAPTGFILDTGGPGSLIYEGSVITSAGLQPFVQGSSIASGTAVDFSVPGATSSESGWSLPIDAGDAVGSNHVAVTAGSGAGVVNTGLAAFFGESVMFDLADGTAGFAPISCFAAETRIRTPAGEVPVRHLLAGDRVVTAAGALRPIRWIGHRAVDCRRHPHPARVLPIRVRAGAFGPGLPLRDLFLSPDHALFLDGALIPVKYLVDGALVAQVARARVCYYHIELAEHDVILAEGLPAETYLDAGRRAAFANGGTVVEAYPRFAASAADARLHWDALGYAPLAVTGPAVERARDRLRAQAARKRKRKRAA